MDNSTGFMESKLAEWLAALIIVISVLVAMSWLVGVAVHSKVKAVTVFDVLYVLDLVTAVSWMVAGVALLLLLL